MSYPHTYIKLTAKERPEVINWLNKLARAHRIQARKRVQAIYFSDRGKTIGKIAKDLEVSERSVRRWFARYRKKGIRGLVGP